jgi:hypothetical protein
MREQLYLLDVDGVIAALWALLIHQIIDCIHFSEGT